MAACGGKPVGHRACLGDWGVAGSTGRNPRNEVLAVPEQASDSEDFFFSLRNGNRLLVATFFNLLPPREPFHAAGRWGLELDLDRDGRIFLPKCERHPGYFWLSDL